MADLAVSETGRSSGSPRNGGWVVLIGVVLAFAALRAAYPVFMPIAAAAFLVALVHPVFTNVRDRANGTVGFIAAFVVVLAGFAVFFGLVGWALTAIVSRLPEYEAEFTQVYESVRSALDGFGVALPAPGNLFSDVSGGSGAATSIAERVGLTLQSFLTHFFLVLAFVALGIPEMRPYGGKLGRIGGMADRLREAAGEVGHKFRAYLGAVTISAAVTAVLSAAFAFAVGLEFALVFALLSFLMNYVPTIGSVIAVVPPTLFSFVQFDGFVMPLVVFVGFSAIELTVGNYVAPKIEGRILSLAPTIVLASIVFWGWLWGIVGALLAVPLTIAIALVCRRFEGAHWLSVIVRESADDAPDTPHGKGNDASGRHR